MFGVQSEFAAKQCKSARADLQLSVGRFHRWMCDAKLGRFMHEYAAVYLCSGIENLIEEILLQCMPSEAIATLTAIGLEQSIANNGDLWGLLQPYVHLFTLFCYYCCCCCALVVILGRLFRRHNLSSSLPSAFFLSCRHFAFETITRIYVIV